MHKLRKLLCVIISLIILSLSALCSTVSFMRVNAADIGYVDATNVNVRADASVNSQCYGKLSNVYVTINSQKIGDDGCIWYNITYNDITGYMRSDFIKKIVAQPNKSFEEQLAAFPESYRDQIKALHAEYPNWKFYADNIDLTLEEAVRLEITQKMVQNTSKKSWRSMESCSYDWNANYWITQNSGWYIASREVIKYYMDPRNFLDRAYIYSFMKQNYDSTSQTEEGLKKIVSGTFLEKDYSDSKDTAYDGSYIKVIMAAAETSGVNPYIIAGTIIREQGITGNSEIISGASGYYNFFNIRASGADPIANGLAYAKNKGWNTRSKAIIDGAQFFSNSYISAGQNTYFYMNYNIKSPDKIYHQYAAAVHNAASSGSYVSKTYADLKYAELDFLIPVYKNMPLTLSELPDENDNLNNYYFNSIDVSGLTPAFSRFTYNYDLNISNDTVVNLSVPDGASYIGAASYQLKEGSNTVKLTVRSQTGYINDYTIDALAQKECVLYIDSGNGVKWSSICGDNATCNLKYDGTLIISGSGATDNYKLKTLTPWYDYSEQITGIEISGDITRIGNNNFNSLTNVTKVIINNPNMTFGYYVFPSDSNAVIYSIGNSPVEEYAKSNNIGFVRFSNPDIPVSPKLAYRSGDSIALEYIDGYEYSIDGVNWQSSSIFENLSAGKTYNLYQRIAEADYAPSKASEALTVTTLSPPDHPVISEINGHTVTLKKVDGYEYSADEIVWQSSNVFSNVSFDKILFFYQRAVSSGNDLSSPSSQPVKCCIVSNPKVLVGKTSLRVKPIAGYEYCLDDMNWQESNEFNELIPEENYTVYQRPKETVDVTVYNNSGTTVCLNGQDIITSSNSTHLAWLRQILLGNGLNNNLAADFNGDGKIDIRDLVALKKKLANIS